nr:four-carbon acid sugar kinase family protein [Halomonas populi]
MAIVADDLTGALDGAAPFAVRGASTRVVVSLERLEAALASWRNALPQVIAVNLESRHLEAQEAASRVRRAVELLAEIEPAQWFKKIDSTLRGQVVAECLAMREACALPLLLAPAVPAQARTVKDAQVYVDGLPLASTVYGRDARSVPPTEPLDELFAPHGVALLRHAPCSQAKLPLSDCVVDSTSDADLAQLYDAMADDPGKWLLAGASGLASAMAQRMFGRIRASRRYFDASIERLYVVGSRCPHALEQLDALMSSCDELQIIEALAPPSSVEHAQCVVVIPGGNATHRDADEVAQTLAERVADAVEHWPLGQGLLFVTGGDTALAVLRRLGVASITVEGEWAPGVVLGYLDGDRERAVITKAGGFGEADLLVRLEASLK